MNFMQGHVPSVVSSLFCLNEKVVYVTKSDFRVEARGISFIGEKTLYVSNFANIFIHDAGGLFKGESVLFYKHSSAKNEFDLDLEESGAISLSEYNVPFEFISTNSRTRVACNLFMTFSLNEYFDLYGNILNCPFLFEGDQALIGVDNLKGDEGNYTLGQLQVEDSELKLILDDELELVVFLNDVEEYTYANHLLTIYGFFPTCLNDSILKKFEIFHPNLTALVAYLEQSTEVICEHELKYHQPMSLASLTGRINDVMYENEPIFLVVDERDYLLVHSITKETILRFSAKGCKKLVSESGIVMVYQDFIFKLHVNEDWVPMLNLQAINSVTDTFLGLTASGVPFLVQVNDHGISLQSSNDYVLKEMAFKEIKEISMTSCLTSNNDYLVTTEFNLGEVNVCYELPHHKIKSLIKQTYRQSLKPMVAKSQLNMIYSSWAKTMNDLLNFQLFGGIYQVKKSIDEICEQELSDSERIDIINTLYYHIQEQRKQFDVLAIYFPKMLENEERKLFNHCQQKLEVKKFKLLQKQLFGLTNQINKNLSDIERSLMPLSSVIFTDISMKNSASAMRSTQMKVGIATSVGASMVMGGALAVPFLATNVMGLYNNYKMEKQLEDVESKRLGLYCNQALDKFNHLVDNMLPYFVSEANDILVDIIQPLAKEYATLDDKVAKSVLFKRMVELYTFKQLPLYDGTTVKRKDLIQEIHAIPNETYYRTDGYLMLG